LDILTSQLSANLASIAGLTSVYLGRSSTPSG
jgi:hypothetical protein